MCFLLWRFIRQFFTFMYFSVLVFLYCSEVSNPKSFFPHCVGLFSYCEYYSIRRCFLICMVIFFIFQKIYIEIVSYHRMLKIILNHPFPNISGLVWITLLVLYVSNSYNRTYFTIRLDILSLVWFDITLDFQIGCKTTKSFFSLFMLLLTKSRVPLSLSIMLPGYFNLHYNFVNLFNIYSWFL